MPQLIESAKPPKVTAEFAALRSSRSPTSCEGRPGSDCGKPCRYGARASRNVISQCRCRVDRFRRRYPKYLPQLSDLPRLANDRGSNLAREQSRSPFNSARDTRAGRNLQTLDRRPQLRILCHRPLTCLRESPRVGCALSGVRRLASQDRCMGQRRSGRERLRCRRE